MLNTLKATLPYLDQPQVVNSIRKASWPVGAAAGGALAWRNAQQQPDKQKALLQNGLVLGATLAGTAVAAKRWFYEPAAAHTLAQPVIDGLKARYGQQTAQLAQKPFKSLSDFKTLMHTVTHQPGVSAALRRQDLHHIAPPPALEEEGFEEVGKFLKLGAVSVGSGFAGGQLNPNAKANRPAMIQEGLFQLVVNIGMCGVGAAAGMMGANAFGHQASRLGRFAWVSGGLAAGIGLGSPVAQWMNKHVVNPLLGKKTADPQQDRTVGWQDLAIHVDDLPLMLMFSGVEAVKPVIPLCFAYSGWRTGSARNKTVATDHNTPPTPSPFLTNRNDKIFAHFTGQPLTS
jgi:hypothetical protein